jgi:fermentation-respiration switch protein FrsA (DUF1100 family)
MCCRRWISRRARRQGCPVVVYGASMGGAAALLAAAEDTRVRAVVADSAYARLSHAVKDWWRNAVGKKCPCCCTRRYLSAGFIRANRRTKVAPEEVIGHIAPRPVLLIHGTHDQLIPPYHAERLYRAAREPKQLWWAEGCAHVQARYETPRRVLPHCWSTSCSKRSTRTIRASNRPQIGGISPRFRGKFNIPPPITP